MRKSIFVVSIFLLVFWSDFSAAEHHGSDGIQPRAARDVNPDPNVVEVIIVAHERDIRFQRGGAKTRVWAYNGGIPGPTIHGNVGDRLIVHFYNFLAEPSTIHWHGLELPAKMDGSNIAQNPVPTGGYFRYDIDIG